jgi:hypothetical protein
MPLLSSVTAILLLFNSVVSNLNLRFIFRFLLEVLGIDQFTEGRVGESRRGLTTKHYSELYPH